MFSAGASDVAYYFIAKSIDLTNAILAVHGEIFGVFYALDFSFITMIPESN